VGLPNLLECEQARALLIRALPRQAFSLEWPRVILMRFDSCIALWKRMKTWGIAFGGRAPKTRQMGGLGDMQVIFELMNQALRDSVLVGEQEE
jgi:hypothetical protein